MWYHPQCCPECKRESEVKKQEEKNTKQLTRVIAFMKSLGGLYADIADDAQEELDYYMRIEILYHERLDDLGLSEIYKK